MTNPHSFVILVLPLILGCQNSRPHTEPCKLSLTESHVPPALEFSVFKALWIEITFLIKRAGPIYHFKNRKLKKQRRNEISFLPVLTEQGLLLAICWSFLVPFSLYINTCLET